MRLAGALEQGLGRPRSLQRHTTWLAFGNAVYAASQWVLLMVTAKLGSPTLVGRLALGFAVAVPITLLTGLQLRSVQATDAKGTIDFRHVFALRMAAGLFGMVLIGLLATFGPWNRAAAIVVVLLGLTKTVDGLSEVCHGALQRLERHDTVARSLLLRGPAGAGAFALGLALTGSVELAVVGLFLGAGAVLVWHDLPGVAACLPRERPLRPEWHTEKLAQLARAALPLGVAAMLVSLMPYIPRYALDRFLGEHDVGVFAALASFVGIGMTLVGALGQAAAPRLAQAHAAGDRKGFAQLTAQMLGIGVLVGAAFLVVAGVAGAPLLTAFYTREYAHYTDVFFLLTVGGAIGYAASSLGYAVTAGLSFRPQVPLFVVVAIVMAISCQILVPTHGLAGAAWAVLGATLTQVVGLGVLWARVALAAEARAEQP